MSLTRDEWVQVWMCIKRIELNRIKHLPPSLSDIKFIKIKIQQVIGQME